MPDDRQVGSTKICCTSSLIEWIDLHCSAIAWSMINLLELVTCTSLIDYSIGWFRWNVSFFCWLHAYWVAASLQAIVEDSYWNVKNFANYMLHSHYCCSLLLMNAECEAPCSCSTCNSITFAVPYKTKCLRWKTFTVFAVVHSTTNVFPWIYGCVD